MKPPLLALDFQASAITPWRVVGFAMLAVGLLATSIVALLQSSADAALTRAEHDRDARLGATAPSPAALHDPRLDAQLVRARTSLDALYLPWNDLFTMVEGAGSQGLGLLGIAPDLANHTLRITGQAKTIDDVLAYVGRLAGQPLLDEVHLISFSTVERDGARAVEFAIGARWKPS